MKCSGVLAWLLASRPGEPLPSEVVGHVDGCTRCRRRCRRLREAEQDLAAEVPPPPPPAARRRLLQQLPDRGRSSRRAPLTRRQRFWLAVAAALFAGFVIGRSLVPTPTTEPRPEHAGPPVAPPDPSTPPTELAGRFVRHHLALADAKEPPQQLPHLLHMAGDLSEEAQKRAAAALPDDLPLIAALYERTVRLGVWKKASEAGPQAPARTAALTELKKAGEQIDRTVAQAAPAMGEFLRPMAGAAREVVVGLERGEAPPEAEAVPLPGAGHGSPQALLASLVMQSLSLTEQGDPIERAESSGEVADHLSLAIQMASARGQNDEARRLGEHLTAVMQQAVRPNLDRAREGTQGDDMGELARAGARADEAVKVLGFQLGKSGPAALPARDAENALKDLSKTLRRIGSQRRGPRPLWQHEVRGVVVGVDVKTRRVSLRLKERGQDVVRAYEVALDTRVRHGPGWLSVWAVPVGTTLRGSHRNGRLAELRVDRPD